MSPIRSCPKSACVGTPKIVVMEPIVVPAKAGTHHRETGPPLSRGRRLPASFDQRAAALLLGSERLVGRDGRADLVVVPRVLRLARLFHFHEVSVVDLAPVLAHAPFAEE